MLRKKLTKIFCLLFIGIFTITSCSNTSVVFIEDGKSPIKEKTKSSPKDFSSIFEKKELPKNPEKISKELVYEGQTEIKFAENFSIDKFEGGFRLLNIIDGTRILVVPEGKKIPKDLDPDIITLQDPVKNLYLLASAAMDMFASIDAVDSIRLSGLNEEKWYIPEAKEAMAKGDMIYAGKYNKPDYELIVSEDCSLVIENMMISHSPEVMEMLESFGLPVMIEYSSYESHPLGRVEWVKFFAALVDKEKEAEKVFEKQVDILEKVNAEDKTNKSVAFFFVTSNGLIQVRQSSDYVPKIIELAGGSYIFDNLGDPNSKKSTMNMQVEEFYQRAKDVDYIIYNSAIDGGIKSIDELLDKAFVLKDFKAVKNKDVWCTSNDMYQQSMSIGYLIDDINKMLKKEDEKKMKYLFKLD